MVKVRVHELPLLLNLFDRFSVYSTYNGIHLVDVDWTKPSVRVVFGRRGWRALVDRVRDVVGFKKIEGEEDLLAEESTLRDSLLSAGILLPPNLGEVLGRVREYLVPPSAERPSPGVLAPDTNVFYNMFLTLLEEELQGRLPRLFVSECVGLELARSVDKKIDRGFLYKLKTSEMWKSGLALGYGASGLRGRRAIGGLHELVRHREKFYYLRWGECRGDESIVKSYVSLKEKWRPLIVTFDDKLRGYAIADRLDSVFVETPPLEKRRYRTSFRRVQRMLYTMSLTYMSLRIEGDNGLEAYINMARRAGDAVDGYVEVRSDDKAVAERLGRLNLYRKVKSDLEKP